MKKEQKGKGEREKGDKPPQHQAGEAEATFVDMVLSHSG